MAAGRGRALPGGLAARVAFALLVTACAGPSGEADERGGAASPGAAGSTGSAVPAVVASGSAAVTASGATPTSGATAAASTGAAPGAGSEGGDAGAGDAGTADAGDAGSADAGDAAVEAGAAGEGAPPYAADNKILPPRESAELTERARGLFDAIVKNEGALGEAFWFPKEPFIPLKDVKGPGKYWDNLHATYLNDIRQQHRKRKSWEGATFVGFQLGSTPKWVPPGDEANKIGYYRSFRGKLRYEIEGKTHTIDVHTVISWQGRWYITHLNRFKKK
ncbi:hypothetical protein [Chondromyces apiculatus]|uniref:Lipoprotein n=1 Tax=Chondromyces apiculatus DSM 436 TaxID=1192034 RepID=A0A017SZR8_9BACT|nr:hypothetical protein [Chondromyces apiculatus]EYF02262.1 Hypothetical protein CAP_7334 [Chondromyces apiculatus DSM 436]